MPEIYDVAIVGAGSAGMTAAIYSARYKLKAVVIASETGGAIVDAHIVENWPGIPKISGLELMNQFREHVRNFNVPFVEEEVLALEGKGPFDVVTKNQKIQAKTLILALGTKRRQLNAKGEKEFLGKGVSYCATCDAAFYGGKTVAVIGGSDSACMAATLVAEFASKVYLIYRKKLLRAEPIWVERVSNNKKIEIIYEANVSEILGSKFVEKIKLDTGKDVAVDGVFIEVGAVPNIALIKNLGVETDKAEQIIVDSEMKTNVPNVCAAGDVTNGKLKQLVTAAGDGARAALSCYNFVKNMEKK